MSILALALFGSCARRDDNANSDVDLLAVTEIDKRWSRSERRINTSFYGASSLLSMSAQGNLFALHLVREALVLYDSKDFFSAFRAAFRYKINYDHEIRQASDLGWFILRNIEDFRDVGSAAKKTAWAVRTILIARAAEARQPVFAADGLADFAGSGDVKSLIEVKSEDRIEPGIANSLKNFLLEFGVREPVATRAGSFSDQISYFKEDENGVALGLVAALFKDDDEHSPY